MKTFFIPLHFMKVELFKEHHVNILSWMYRIYQFPDLKTIYFIVTS